MGQTNKTHLNLQGNFLHTVCFLEKNILNIPIYYWNVFRCSTFGHFYLKFLHNLKSPAYLQPICRPQQLSSSPHVFYYFLVMLLLFSYFLITMWLLLTILCISWCLKALLFRSIIFEGVNMLPYRITQSKWTSTCSGTVNITRALLSTLYYFKGTWVFLFSDNLYLHFTTFILCFKADYELQSYTKLYKAGILSEWLSLN